MPASSTPGMSTARQERRARWADLCSVFAPAAAMSGLLTFGVVDVELGAPACAILLMGGIATLAGADLGIATSEPSTPTQADHAGTCATSGVSSR